VSSVAHTREPPAKHSTASVHPKLPTRRGVTGKNIARSNQEYPAVTGASEEYTKLHFTHFSLRIYINKVQFGRRTFILLYFYVILESDTCAVTVDARHTLDDGRIPPKHLIYTDK
jgi:hypothetical protein